MFKKIVMFAVTAAAGIMLLTGCSPKETPTQVVEKVNTISIFEDYDSLKDNLTDDVVWKDEQGKKHDKDDIKAMSKFLKFFEKDDLTFLEFAKLTQDKNVQKALDFNDADIEENEEIIANWDNIPAEEKESMNSVIKQMAKVFREGSKKVKKSFKVIKEEVNGDTATVTAKYTDFNPDEKTGELKEDGKIEIVYTLKKIDNTWKISKVVESKK